MADKNANTSGQVPAAPPAPTAGEIAAATAEVIRLLSPFEAEAQRRILSSTATMLGIHSNGGGQRPNAAPRSNNNSNNTRR